MKEPELLLIFDIDETLVSTIPVNKDINIEIDDIIYVPNYKHDPNVYIIRKRPGLEMLLNRVKKHYKIGFWSAGGKDYVDFVIEQVIKPILDPIIPTFVWSNKKCTIKRFSSFEMEGEFNNRLFIIKDLKKVWRNKDYSKHNTIIIDDNYTTFIRNYGNAIPIAEFKGCKDDNKLEWLWNTYLSLLKNSTNIRSDLTDLKRLNGWQ